MEEIPSIKKTLRAFHAKDDCAEVRQAVFKVAVDLEFKAQFVVARKIERIFRNRFQHDENRFYDYLVARLFQNVLHKNQENVIYFAKRGSRKRPKPLQQALQAGIKTFEEKWQVKVESRFDVQSQSLVGEPCLQLIDYMNWAVYRVFTRVETRYFNYVREKVSLVWDIYDSKSYPGNYYSKRNPLKVEKISPL